MKGYGQVMVINLITTIGAASFVALMVVNIVRIKRRRAVSIKAYGAGIVMAIVLAVLNVADGAWLDAVIWTFAAGTGIGAWHYARRTAELQRRITDG